MNCESCKVEINAESAIDGHCARCARPEKAPEPARAAPMKPKLEAAGETSGPGRDPDHDEPWPPARAEPAHLGHAHPKAEPADHGKSSKHK